MVKWIKSNILDLIQSVGLVGATVVALVVWLQRVPWYLALLGLLFAVVLILFGINQYEIRKERHKKGLTKLSDKEIENKVLEWIKHPSWSIQPLSADGFLFALVLKHGELPIQIERRIKEPTVIYLSSGVILTRKNKVISKNDWERLAGNLSIKMAQHGIGFSFPCDEPYTMRLIHYVILDDSLTGFYFREQVMFVVRALILVSVLSNSFYGGIPDKPTPDKGDSQS